jgi:hypothetical protein
MYVWTKSLNGDLLSRVTNHLLSGTIQVTGRKVTVNWELDTLRKMKDGREIR